MLKKTFVNNIRKTRGLRNTLKKGFKYICENGNKYYFCTRNEGDVLNKILEKKAKKDLQGMNKGFTFALRKTIKFFDRVE